ncbi:hypothetical protein Peur_074556 [Populus x canadensis]
MSMFREGKALKTEAAQLSKEEDGSKEAREEEGENMDLEDISSKTISSIERLHKMLRLHDNGLAAVERNSIQCLSEGGVAFGAIGGGFAAEEQRQCTQEIAKQNVSATIKSWNNFLSSKKVRDIFAVPISSSSSSHHLEF